MQQHCNNEKFEIDKSGYLRNYRNGWLILVDEVFKLVLTSDETEKQQIK